MAVTYTLVPIPRWYIANIAGLPLGAGSMQTFRSVDKNTSKAIYTDATGATAWPNPVNFNANGTAPGMFFWANDEPYFIAIYDGPNATGSVIFTADNYGPAVAGGGGGGTINVSNSLKNFVVNNVFYRNINSNASYVTITSGTVVAPSCHEGFRYQDIQYLTSGGSGSTDQVKFPTTNGDFNLGAILLTGDVTPETYIDWTCMVAGTETLKTFQFPIDLHIKNLEQQTMTAMIWAKGISGTQNLTMNFVQDLGTPNAISTQILTTIPIAASPLMNSWQPYTATFQVPSVLAKVVGSGGDDASYIQVSLPTGNVSNILFTKPKLYLGTVGQVFPELQTYDEVDSIICTPRTGDIRTSLNSFAPFGWVAANDGSIGSALSAATNRKNMDTWQLYNLIWNTILDNWAPVSSGRGASAYADFTANKTLTMTRMLGRVLAGQNPLTITSQTFTTAYAGNKFNLIVTSSSLFTKGTPVLLTNTGGSLPASLAVNTVYFVININATTIQLATTIENSYAGIPIDMGGDQTGTSTVQQALGAYVGESLHSLTVAELAAHTHNARDASPIGTFGIRNVSPNGTFSYQTSAGNDSKDVISTGTTGSGTGHNTIQPTTYMNVFIKL